MEPPYHYGEPASAIQGASRPLPLRERLEAEKKKLLDRIQNINSLLELLDDNPDFEKFHDLLTKSSY